jgi:hypothetical protein
MRKFQLIIALAIACGFAGNLSAGIIVHTSDFVPDASVTNFNGFEGITLVDGFHYGSFTYTEGGITVTQVNPSDQIWVNASFWNHEGNYEWYPDGGDHGYTSITMADNSDFQSVEMLIGTGFFTAGTTYYVLLENGVQVFSGSLGSPTQPNALNLGFSGGGFNQILLRDSQNPGDTMYSGSSNALALDSIEVANAPEPASFLLAGIGVAATAMLRRRAGR